MAKSKTLSFWDGLLSVGLYKRNQGRLTRQLTAAALGLILALGMWTLSNNLLADYDNPVILSFPLRQWLPFLLFLVGMWLVYRIVNYPRFADFLISVEAEIDKVTWASKAELYRATVVVLIVMFTIGSILYLYDFIWLYFFRFLRVVLF
jgi:preprotein translocase subunit SecE